jgi:hypothetical protein
MTAHNPSIGKLRAVIDCPYRQIEVMIGGLTSTPKGHNVPWRNLTPVETYICDI